MRIIWFLTIGVTLLSPAASPGQSIIHPVRKFAWGENVGWTNWRDANGPGPWRTRTPVW